MKRNLTVFLIGAVVVTAFLLFRKPPDVVPKRPRPEPHKEKKFRQIKPEQTRAAPAGKKGIVPPLLVGRVEKPKIKPVEMSDEEFRLFEESFKVMAPMTAFLDAGEELKALYEARKLLQHPNREVRLETARSLRWIGLPAAMELAKMIDDSDGEIRNLAQEAFWKVLDQANPSLKRDLMAEALCSNDPEVRARVLQGAVFLPDTLSFSLLASAMDDPDKEVAALARENVTFVSGEEFSTRKAAEAWFEANKERLQQMQ